ncbi:MAG TPA: FAD-dependent oxidoreductase [Symbiobacteriaceae bacterium]|nr:FAD-dependent oxidoreductase [Symbiobacteriaceae bacterium]
MTTFRIDQHPILPRPQREPVPFFWQGRQLVALEGETISSALFANGVRTFGHHHKDGAPQGIFCANGQCAQCLVLADGKPVKSCMELVQPNMRVAPADGLPELPPAPAAAPKVASVTPEIEVPVLIIGGGPSGLAAAAQLGRMGIRCLLVDDKHRLGGKLVLQTHRFFGSVDAVWAGTRGIDIATKLEQQVREQPSVEIWHNSTAVAVFSDKKVGVLKEGHTYTLVKPQVTLVATGAREKNLMFKGNTLPGVYGAGAFQTLVNRDLVRPTERLFIVGGGNVGLIGGYHALQAGVEVVGLVEAAKDCGGYKVHKDKLVRMGVPIYTSHTILSANGKEAVESVTIARVDEKFRPIPGTEKSFACDTILIAVGLDPVNEFYLKAKEFGMTVFAAGDAEEIAEASAAIFSGKITGLEVAKALGYEAGEVPQDWYRMSEILKSRPGQNFEERIPEWEEGVFPVFHCTQEIPCNPCTSACSSGLIRIDESDIRAVPVFTKVGPNGKSCAGCEKCVTTCPGLAITMVDYRKDAEFPEVTVSYEFLKDSIRVGDVVTVLDTLGNELGEAIVSGVKALKAYDRSIAVKMKAPKAIAKRIAGIRVQAQEITLPLEQSVERFEDDTIICRCGRVTAGEIRQLIRDGYRDINQIKVVTRSTMGACGGKNCGPLIMRIFREEGVAPAAVIQNVPRPLFVEIPLGVFAGAGEGDDHE